MHEHILCRNEDLSWDPQQHLKSHVMATHVPVSPELWETRRGEFLVVAGHQSNFGISETLSQGNKVEENDKARHVVSFSGLCMGGHTCTCTYMHMHYITHTQTHICTHKNPKINVKTT